MQHEGSFCQSCGMPLTKPEDLGTQADGTLSDTYCTYCYQNGTFTGSDTTLEEMIEIIHFDATVNVEFPVDQGRFKDPVDLDEVGQHLFVSPMLDRHQRIRYNWIRSRHIRSTSQYIVDLMLITISCSTLLNEVTVDPSANVSFLSDR